MAAKGVKVKVSKSKQMRKTLHRKVDAIMKKSRKKAEELNIPSENMVENIVLSVNHAKQKSDESQSKVQKLELALAKAKQEAEDDTRVVRVLDGVLDDVMALHPVAQK